MHLSPFWLFLIAGVGLLALEMLVFQFTTFWLFFLGLGALVAAAYAWISGDLVYTPTVAVFLVASVTLTALMYKPIRRMQKQPSGLSDNNAIGQRVTVKEAISSSTQGLVNWSGSDWQAELAPGETANLAVGDEAQVVSVKGIRLFVKPYPV